MRVLVVGATGFIGQPLVSALVEAGSEVRGLARSRPQVSSWHKGDLTQRPTLRGCCADQEIVYHVAGVAHTRASAAQHHAVTVAGTEALLDEAVRAGVGRFIFMSSIKAECSDDDYAKSRRAAESLVLAAGFATTVIVRPALVYSPGMRGNLGRVLTAARLPLPLPVPRGGALRSLVHRDDLVRVLMALRALPPFRGTYTVTDGSPHTLRTMYDLMRAGFGRSGTPYALPQGVLPSVARIGDAVSRITGRPCRFDARSLAPLLEACVSEDMRVWHDLGLQPRHSLSSAIPTLIAAHSAARARS